MRLLMVILVVIREMANAITTAGPTRDPGNAEMEVRVTSVPESWVPPKPGTFVKEVMNELADLGEKMGAEPANWRTEAP